MRFQILALVLHLVAFTGAALVELEIYKVGDPTVTKWYCEMSQQKWKTNDDALKLLDEESTKIPDAKSAFKKASKAENKCVSIIMVQVANILQICFVCGLIIT